jgi:hypothetical protein
MPDKNQQSAAAEQSIESDKAEITPNIHTYCACIIRESTKITKHPSTSTVKTVTDKRKPGFICFPPSYPPNHLCP